MPNVTFICPLKTWGKISRFFYDYLCFYCCFWRVFFRGGYGNVKLEQIHALYIIIRLKNTCLGFQKKILLYSYFMSEFVHCPLVSVFSSEKIGQWQLSKIEILLAK